MAAQPIVVELRKGAEYRWCACGRSASQPFCDGPHAEGDCRPLSFVARYDERAWLCVCKASKHPPFCDGSHNKLKTPG